MADYPVEHLVDFKGFGIEDEELYEQETLEQTGEKYEKTQKKTEKMRKEFAKLMLGTDANISMAPPKNQRASIAQPSSRDGPK